MTEEEKEFAKYVFDWFIGLDHSLACKKKIIVDVAYSSIAGISFCVKITDNLYSYSARPTTEVAILSTIKMINERLGNNK